MSSDHEFDHDPVMINEIITTFDGVPDGAYVDATLGGAGHARAVLEHHAQLRLIGIDRDPAALAAARAHLAPVADRVQLVRGRFGEFGRLVDDVTAAHAQWSPVAAVLFDLGVSSPQLDVAERGFSYRHDGPLDMRMDPDQTLRADDIVNSWSSARLAEVLDRYGDERFARRVATAICAARPINSTTQLAEIVRDAIPAATRRTGGHPAKRSFQALRIAVNEELDQLEPALHAAIDRLEPGGCGAVLSYHSGEDRIVKRVIADRESGGCTCPPRLPCVCGATPAIETLRPKTRTASDAELERNPRAASARLRCFRRLATTTDQTATDQTTADQTTDMGAAHPDDPPRRP